jgi:hypothetical protein
MGILSRLDERADLLSAMTRRMRVNLDESDGFIAEGLVRQMIMGCMMCRNVESCRAWLADADVGAPPPAFCPNREALLALARADA